MTITTPRSFAQMMPEDLAQALPLIKQAGRDLRDKVLLCKVSQGAQSHTPLLRNYILYCTLVLHTQDQRTSHTLMKAEVAQHVAGAS